METLGTYSMKKKKTLLLSFSIHCVLTLLKPAAMTYTMQRASKSRKALCWRCNDVGNFPSGNSLFQQRFLGCCQSPLQAH